MNQIEMFVSAVEVFDRISEARVNTKSLLVEVGRIISQTFHLQADMTFLSPSQDKPCGREQIYTPEMKLLSGSELSSL